ncbi:hypothetical protein, partial [Leptospira interrogans]
PKIRAGTKFYRRFCRNSDRFILRSNYLWVRLWFSMNRVGKLNTTLFMNRVVGWAKFYRGFVVIPTDLY